MSHDWSCFFIIREYLPVSDQLLRSPFVDIIRTIFMTTHLEDFYHRGFHVRCDESGYLRQALDVYHKLFSRWYQSTVNSDIVW